MAQKKSVKEKQQATTAADDFLGQAQDPGNQKTEKVEQKKKSEEEGSAKTITPDMMEEFREMMKKMQSTIDQQASEINALKSAPAPQQDYDQVSVFDIDDYMDVPAVFYAFSTYYSLFGDKRYGKTVFTPNDQPVRFEKAYRWQRNSPTGGRGTETVSICQATIRSKAVAKWLREHSLFNIKFFENLKEATSVDTMLAEKMAWATSMISGMNDYLVIERAKVEGTLINPDIMVTRRVLIEHLARKAMAQEKMRNEEKTKKLLPISSNVEEPVISEDRASMLAKDTAVE